MSRMKRKLILSNNLRDRRIMFNMSQEELASRCGTTRATISAIERGVFAPTAYLAAILCAALMCNFEDLFFLELLEEPP